MADDEASSYPICTIKMDINCCQNCPLKLERKLLKSDGVESVTINPHKGLVTVIGDIDPVVLLQKLQAMGKKPKLWFFQKEPDRDDEATDRSKSASKTEHDSIESDSNNEDDKQFNWHSQHKCVTETMEMKEAMSSDVHSCLYPRSLPPAISSDVHTSSYSRSLPSAMSSDVHPYPYSRSLPRVGYQPAWPYQQSVPGHTFTPHCYYLQPHLPPPTYRYFQHRSPPRDNPMVHYTDYADNYRF